VLLPPPRLLAALSLSLLSMVLGGKQPALSISPCALPPKPSSASQAHMASNIMPVAP
jgi:hypothetical protein